ncbi:MAG: F0F1 ATP synthase subunit B [Candidatus Harrisonbacteria bacterium]|nr:F0F1 ATP synthase subunit B [Candidatus Harrisonbacteria bacterium]
MELFAKLGINWKLLFAQAFNFLVVLWLLKRYVFPKIVGIIEERREKIEKGLAMHREAEKELSRVEIKRKEVLTRADAEAEKLMGDAKTLAEKRLTEVEARAKTVAEGVLQKAKAQAETLHKDALHGAKADIRAAALMVAEKILARKVTAEDDERAVEEVIGVIANDANRAR